MPDGKTYVFPIFFHHLGKIPCGSDKMHMQVVEKLYISNRHNKTLT
jgi:hypothetical protein